MNTTKGCLLDSSNCSQANAFFDSWRKVLSFFFTPPLETLCSVWYYTSSSLFFSIFHFLYTNFRKRPSSEKTIQGLLHLIYIINRCTNDPLSKKKQNKHRNKQDGRDILKLCPDLPIQQKPGYLEFCEMHSFHIVWLCCKHIF